jgi:CBS domain-containing protein
MNASDIVVREVMTTDPQASVSQVAKQLADNDISALPVVDDAGRMVGIISVARGAMAARRRRAQGDARD